MFQIILQQRRARRYSESKFQRSRVSERLLVPRHVPVHLRLYITYLEKGLGEAIRHDSGRGPDIYLGFAKHSLHVPQKSRFILVQHEQTHVSAPDPSDLDEVAAFRDDPAMLEVLDGVRLHGSPDAFDRADQIIEYSIANQINVLNSPLSRLYFNKSHYIAPLIGRLGTRLTARQEFKVVTMFGQPELGRRGKTLGKLRRSGVQVTNLRNFEDYRLAFEDCAVLINLGQKGYLQTPEELRILPALLEGVLVVTEENRFLDQLPYRDFLIATPLADLPDTLTQIRAGYNQIWTATFTSSENSDQGFTQVLRKIEARNKDSFRELAS